MPIFHDINTKPEYWWCAGDISEPLCAGPQAHFNMGGL